jgi:hypothetical protein
MNSYYVCYLPWHKFGLILRLQDEIVLILQLQEYILR